MYRILIRPILFAFPPEWIHRAVARLLPAFFAIPGVRQLVRNHYTVKDSRLEREVFGIRFPNPVGIAAGFDKEVSLYNELADLGFGHVEVGTVTPRGQKGNPTPRLFRLTKDDALINRMGFNNHGVEACIRNIKRKHPGVIIGGNIGKNTDTPNENAVDDYSYCFKALFDLVDYFVVNISCPNIQHLKKLQNKDETIKILTALQAINHNKEHQKPILLKISPDLTNSQLDEIVDIVKETNLDGVVATNTTTSRDHLQTSQKKLNNIGDGGLSGKPLREKATRVISYLHKKSSGTIPIIGVGGIADPADAIDKINAGASLVQVYTGFIYSGPSLAKRINKKLLKKTAASMD